MNPFFTQSLQMTVAILALLGTLYAFHRKVIMSDIQATVLTKAEAKKMEEDIESKYSKELGEKLEAELADVKNDIREGFREIHSDIKELLKRG